MRIVSLIPSATEIVYALGLGEQLYGVTHECDFPEDALTKPVLVKPFVTTDGLTSLEIDQAFKARLASGQPIWLDPLMVGGHWIPGLVDLAGGVDCTGDPGQPSKTITWDEFQQFRVDFVLIMLCGFDAIQGKDHLRWLLDKQGWDSLPGVNNDKVVVLDGNSYFSRSGPRLLDGLEVIFNTIHPHPQ